MRPRVVIMAKQPVLGTVKTRLGHDIGPVAATNWYRNCLFGLLRRLDDPRWSLSVALAPQPSRGMAHRLFADTRIVGQGRGDLGCRMRSVFDGAANPTLIIGSDIPFISRSDIWRAITLLRSSDAVMGPAPDGGYWLVGLKSPERMPRQFMKNIRWSTAHAGQDTRDSAPHFVWSQADKRRDVDTYADILAMAATNPQ